MTGTADASTPTEPPTGLAEAAREAIDKNSAKPLLRGWLHQGFTPVMLIAGLVLVAVGRSVGIRLASGAYVACALLLFGNSAFYHRGNWTPPVKAVFRRVDHANIFVFIAGSYTPLAVAMLTGRSRVTLLVLIWTLGVLGVLFRVCWLSAPRWLYTALYVVMGWVALWWLPDFWRAGGPAVVLLIAAGGVVYTLGAVVYGMKRPDPWPATFGFHEIFHSCTVIAAICHFIAICLVVVD